MGRTLYGHDAAGYRNLKAEGNSETRYVYEPSGLLLRVDLPGDGKAGRRIKYSYDSNGLRTEKRVNNTLVEAYRWLDPLRLGEFHDGRQWWRLAYLEGRAPVGLTNGEDSYFLLCDQVGTPLALANIDGSVVQKMRYDSFGNLLETSGAVVQLPVGFAGGLFDADTGLTRFVWRDYDAATGRFTALDPLGAGGGDPDWYGYCVDDPVNRVDAWGLIDSFATKDNVEHQDCINSAQSWKRQCKQLAEFGSYVIGGNRPVRGWGLGEAGDWVCDKIYEGTTDRCEDNYGGFKKTPDNDSPPDSSD